MSVCLSVCLTIWIWPSYLTITLQQPLKAIFFFMTVLRDNHIYIWFQFYTFSSCSRTITLSNISKTSQTFWSHCLHFPCIEPNTLQQNSEERLYSRHEFHYLNVPSVGKVMVTDEFECCFKCLRNPSCFSVNLAASQTVSKKLWCELLPSHKYNSPEKCQQKKNSHHIYIMVRFVF